MTIRLHLRALRVLEVVADDPERLVVAVVATSRRLQCAWCGFSTAKVHETKTVKVKDLPVGGRRVMLLWRRRLQRREPRGHVTPAFDPEVFRARFFALRRADRLQEAESERLEALFAAHAELARAWQMPQELHCLYLAEDEEHAMEALDRFADLYEVDMVPEFYKVVDTLLHWAPEILNFHRGGRWSNGKMEGTNNKLGVLKRTAYGFRNASNFEARGILLTPPKFVT